MLHIATVHHRFPQWIEIQARYLRKHISIPYRTWTSLEGIDPHYAVHFDRIIDQAGGHAAKLNNLAVEISHQAEDGDLLMFLDGDAFPIADPMPLILDGLARAPLIAARRADNGGDEQPHPCFCVTTVRTWRQLPGDWSMGHRWTLPDGRRPTDVGGNLLRTLELTETPWVEVLRSNPVQIDPLIFAIYGDTIYHHGAGFRKRGGASRGHYDSQPKPLPAPRARVLREVVEQIDRGRVLSWRLKTRGPQLLESKRVHERIQRDDRDWLADVKVGASSR